MGLCPLGRDKEEQRWQVTSWGSSLCLQGESHAQSPKTVRSSLPNAEKTQGSKNHQHDGIIDPASHFPACQAAWPLLICLNCAQLQGCLSIPSLAIRQPGEQPGRSRL